MFAPDIIAADGASIERAEILAILFDTTNTFWLVSN
jgi:hypothetical protein